MRELSFGQPLGTDDFQRWAEECIHEIERASLEYSGEGSAAVTAAAGSANPLMDGVAAPGTSTSLSRQDHVHPIDTSRAPLASPTFTGTPAAPTAGLGTNTTQLATTAFVLANLSGAIKVLRTQTFTSSGTYTPNANMVYALIELVGGGGGGGGVTGAAGTNYFGAGGGGAGSEAMLIASAATIGASKTVTIGAAGAGGAGSNNGTAGGDTSVGTICIGKGGSGGQYTATAVQLGIGGLGGVAGTGDVTPTGMPGNGGSYSGAGVNVQLPSGMGGSSRYGGGGNAVWNGGVNAGNAGTGKGSGGSGAYIATTASTATGGAGTAGYVRITEFCTA